MVNLEDFIEKIDAHSVTGEPNFQLPDILRMMRDRHQCGYKH